MQDLKIYQIIVESGIIPLDDNGKPMIYLGIPPARLDPKNKVFVAMQIETQNYVRDRRLQTYWIQYTIQLEVFANSAENVANMIDKLQELFQSRYGQSQMNGAKLQQVADERLNYRWYSSLTFMFGSNP